MTAEQPGGALVGVLRESREELLEAWIARQKSGETWRPDLLTEPDNRAESEELLAALAAAVRKGDPADIHGPEWAPVRELLERISASRDEQGFSPTETATFVLSLKRPLAEHLEKETDGAQLSEAVWTANALLDRLGLFTTEVYRRNREAVIARQQEEMLELSTPVIKLWDGILALPLIGTLDTARSQMVTETLLDAIVKTGSQIAIIDLTGVPTVDTRMAQHLLRTFAAVRLMGSECIVSGIRPQIAQTMVHLQIDLGEVRTEATLAAALAVALERVGLAVTAPAGETEGS